ncbi:MAG: ASKHA domain-containing protein [Eubacteriales bacterium]
MRDIVVNKNLHIEIDRKAVFDKMECYEDSPLYEEIVEEYEELYPVMMEALDLKAVIAFGEVPFNHGIENELPAGSKALYTIVTIGKKASELSNSYFAEGDCVKGMLADSLADICVFAMEKDLLQMVREECEKRQVGIRHRYEAPVDIPMTYQKIAFEMTEANINLEMDITSGYMLDPLKSNCQVFGITDDTSMFRLEHDCRTCPNLTCSQRNVPDTMVVVYGNHKEKLMEISCREQESILASFIRHGGYLSAPCGGHGTCGKCKVKVIEGNLPITTFDEKYFSKEELAEGYRLSCKAFPKEACSIALLQDQEEEFEVLGVDNEGQDLVVNIEDEKQFGLAIDIGTTTIAISLVATDAKQVIDTFTTINHQRMYGGDVISRIQASNDGKGRELRESIQKDLLEGIHHLTAKYNIPKEKLATIVIAGNTTMGHLLMEFSCETLGVVPFTPVDIGLIEKSFEEIFDTGDFPETKVVLLPGISTYVGADIVSGIYAHHMMKSKEYNLLVDLGTNGEMAIGNADKILVTSTAVGPAFEGGNIACGMGGVPGAICGATLVYGKMEYETIGNKPAVGICGTGVVEIVAELVKGELVDDTGLLDEEYFDDGYPITISPAGEEIIFEQKDVREIQLAKSAVRAGVETLIKRMGITYDDIAHLYMAGGFGFNLDKEKAVSIGLFPEKLLDKIETVGNTSLQGAIQYIFQDTPREEMIEIAQSAEEINLSMDKDFNDFYVDNMFFE